MTQHTGQQEVTQHTGLLLITYILQTFSAKGLLRGHLNSIHLRDDNPERAESGGKLSCGVKECHAVYSTKHKLVKHLKTKHPRQPQYLKEVINNIKQTREKRTCNYCSVSVSQQHLKRHQVRCTRGRVIQDHIPPQSSTGENTFFPFYPNTNLNLF